MAAYGSEADLCESAGACLASCIMLAATIEGYLVICVSTLPEEAEQAIKRLKAAKQAKAKRIKKGLKVSSVLNWDLGDLLQVAIEAKWLPSEALKRFPFPVADTSDVLSADRIRELRNLVHPGCLVRERNGQTITREELDLLRETCLAVSLHLSQKLTPQLWNREMPSRRIQF
jgi:hypothetical protein